MMRYFCILLFICIMAACSSDDMPSNILPLEKMQPVLYDVLRAQELANIKYGSDTVALNANMPVMLQQILDIHKVSKEDFYNSFTYYEAHPDINKDLFDSLASYNDRAKQDFYRAPPKIQRR